MKHHQLTLLSPSQANCGSVWAKVNIAAAADVVLNPGHESVCVKLLGVHNTGKRKRTSTNHGSPDFCHCFKWKEQAGKAAANVGSVRMRRFTQQSEKLYVRIFFFIFILFFEKYHCRL